MQSRKPHTLSLFQLLSRFFPETPRFLLVHGKYDEALSVLRRVAKWNKKEMPLDDIKLPQQAENEKADFRDLFYNKEITMTTLVTWFSW